MAQRTAVRIAMWSGPRNISTAMMRAWDSRPDTAVCDEPLYAFYLRRTGLDHPGAAEVLARHDDDWRRVTEWLVGPVPDGCAIFFQKQMAHHLLPEIGRAWLDRLTHAFLIRDPRAMLISLAKHLPRPTLEDTGLPQQVELFRERRRLGESPPVLDARDVLEQPEPMLRRLSDSLDVPFLPSMLRWEPGPRETDGVWARHWYREVATSTGFRPWRPNDAPLRPGLEPLLAACRPLYDELHACRLTAA